MSNKSIWAKRVSNAIKLFAACFIAGAGFLSAYTLFRLAFKLGGL